MNHPTPPQPIPIDPPPPIQHPPKSAAGDVATELKERRRLLDRAEEWLKEAQTAQWERPGRVGNIDAPDRTSIGSHTDPTGEAAINEQRDNLRRAMVQLTRTQLDPTDANRIDAHLTIISKMSTQLDRELAQLARAMLGMNIRNANAIDQAARAWARYHQEDFT